MTDFDRHAGGTGILLGGPSDFAGVRNSVQDALERGCRLDDIEREIDAPALRLETDERAALWLYAEAHADLHPRGRCARPRIRRSAAVRRLHLIDPGPDGRHP